MTFPTPTSSRPLTPLILALIAVLGLAVFFLTWKIDLKPLENWDEGIHAEVSREMYRDGSWLSLSYRDQLYTAKPPLKFWLTAALFPIFGETELAIRLWSSLAGIATAIVLVWWIWQISGSGRLAFFTGAVFVSGRFVLYHAFRTGETDGLTAFFVTAAMYCWWRVWRSTSQSSQVQPPYRSWLLVFGVLVGLIAMTKSLAAALPIVIAVVDLTLARRWRRLDWRSVGFSAAVAAAIIAPWHLAMTIRHGLDFWSSYVGFHVVDRIQEVLYANDVAWYWYADVMAKRLFPWTVLVPAAVLMSVRRWRRSGDDVDRLLLIWMATVFVVFSAVQTKFDWYVLPLYPAVVIVLARGVTEFLHQRNDRLLIVLAGLAVFGTIALLPDGLAHEGLLWMLTPFGWIDDRLATSLIGRLAVAAAVTAAVLIMTWALRAQTVIAPTRAIGMVVVIGLLFMAVGWQASYLRHLPSDGAFRDIAAELERRGGSSLDVVEIDLLRQPAGYFYLRRVPGLKVHELSTGQAIGSDYLLTTKDMAAQLSVDRPVEGAILERGSYLLFQRSPTP